MTAPTDDTPGQRDSAERPVIAVIGNPNTGKSTLFNTLTGLRQKTANYPGVTVERHTGELRLPGVDVTLVDLPGTYSIAAQSADEMIAADVLLGRFPDLPRPSAVLIVADAANLRRNLFLTSQILELGLPVVVALNMADLARQQGIEIDDSALASALGARVIPFVATTGQGVSRLRSALRSALNETPTPRASLLPEVRREAVTLAERHRPGDTTAPHEFERALIDVEGYAEHRLVATLDDDIGAEFTAIRAALAPDGTLGELEARRRYAWINKIAAEVETRGEPVQDLSSRIARITDHPVWGGITFVLVMATVFQAVFAWAAPLMDLIDAAAVAMGAWISATLPPGAFASLLTDGVIAGVGSVLIFLPQILILFAFIIFLEDSGYMARAAFLMDRIMRACGLSGQSFIPMLSSFACAIPGIMATRVIPSRRDRLATIMSAPFMTCSARLPIYALFIAAFVPDQTYLGGLVNLHGLVLLGLYLLGILGGIATAALMKKTLLRGPTPSFLIELPPYRMPNLRSMGIRLLDRGRIFVRRAGTVIFSVALIIWGLAYFPQTPSLSDATVAPTVVAAPSGEAALSTPAPNEQIRQSYLGRIGQTIEPLFEPLGWDWRIAACPLSTFPMVTSRCSTRTIQS